MLPTPLELARLADWRERRSAGLAVGVVDEGKRTAELFYLTSAATRYIYQTCLTRTKRQRPRLARAAEYGADVGVRPKAED